MSRIVAKAGITSLIVGLVLVQVNLLVDAVLPSRVIADADGDIQSSAVPGYLWVLPIVLCVLGVLAVIAGFTRAAQDAERAGEE